MSLTKRAAVLIIAMTAGCGQPPTTINGVQLIAGFNPPQPTTDETVIISPVIPGIKPGSDTTYCSYIDYTFPANIDITHWHGAQSKAGHHVILFAAQRHRPTDTHVCTDDDMVNADHFIAASGAEGLGAGSQANLAIPDGLAFTGTAGAQLMVQTHWINASMETLDAQAVIYVTTKPTDGSRVAADLMAIYTSNIAVPPQQTASSTTTCKMTQDLQLFSLIGHEHQWGKHVKIELLDAANTASTLWEYDWNPTYISDPPINVYSVEKPLLLKTGTSIRLTCTWDNTTNDMLGFPREMCVAQGFYFPAHGAVECGDGSW
jgi:hypothetical protein